MEDRQQDNRALMPKCAEMIDEFAKRFGTQHVRAAIEQGKAGQPGVFYAYERTKAGVQKTGTPPQGKDATRLREFFTAFGPPAALVVMAPQESE